MNVLITGASSGLGKSLLNEFTSRGCSVWGVARRNVEEVRFAPNSQGKWFYSQCDITDANAVKKTVRDMIAVDFVPDIVILNAGAAFDDIINGIDYNSFKENFNLNLFGAMNWVSEILPIFLLRNKGIFVAISTLSVFRENHRNRIAYSSAKSALSTVFENLRLQYYSSEIQFVVVHAGRMSNERSFIGTTYDAAARLIADKLLSGNIPHTINFPLFQSLLTKLSRLIPDSLFYKYCMK
ncbi:MAG TPA: SDR family NAD(P)-dependent oxidoreductase [Candidatus Avalokitesvara rifleensis]|uniref:SDR family NAD(P)-dependent oxidoreductase n=1 Tax=Candidatus Avalokitesvara rifleensis TaxID=3367620 RepID=UPI0027140DD3|nr:SDR family oxidoreductase [Candidatus Brocadiales bacterium]